MKKINYKSILVFSIVLVLLLVGGDLLAQCPMCKMSAETNLKNGGTMGRGLNKGILYILSAPYLFVGVLAYLWVRNRKKVDADDAVQPDTSLFSEN
jgi:hypothetical protein